jgi:hypothetical protein
MPLPKAQTSFSASSTGIVSISAETYARLLSLADQAPLECLPLTSRTLACARTMGYNQIGQIRSTPSSRLFADLGEERAEELQRALYDFGMRPPLAADQAG